MCWRGNRKPYNDCMDREQYVKDFEYEVNLLRLDREAMGTYAGYLEAVRLLRKSHAKRLRELGMPGWLRAEYNSALSAKSLGYREYLFYRDPVCQLCGCVIASLGEATIDHIVPKSLGGGNTRENYQLAHAVCNGIKGNRNIRVLPARSFV